MSLIPALLFRCPTCSLKYKGKTPADIFALDINSIYSNTLGPAELVSKLKSQPDTSLGLPTEYLVELIDRFNDDGLDMVSSCSIKIPLELTEITRSLDLR